jgi:hypothetical protein
MKKTVLHILLVMLLSGCASMKVDQNTSRPEQGEAIIVMGVTPDNAVPAIFKGIEVGNGFLRKSELGINPAKTTNGYQVFRARSGEVYGLTQIMLMYGLVSDSYLSCDGSETTTFQPRDGEVLYLGHFNFKVAQSKLSMSVKNDIFSASAFIDQNYPKLSGKLKKAKLTAMPSKEACSKLIILPSGKGGRGMMILEMDTVR